MSDDRIHQFEDRLRASLEGIGPVAVAVSGGVDSVTLAVFARETLGPDAVLAIHAASPAVPRAASERVRSLARSRGFRLRVLDAGEFGDERYRENPVNRCFFCKTNLYGTLGAETSWPLASGTNLDDLGDFRPGLKAASDHGVRHPFVEAGVDKEGVRALARALDLHDVAELPSAPCLSSRIETGIRIEADELAFVDRVERTLRETLEADGASRSVRCRVQARRIVIELDARTLEELPADGRGDLVGQIAGWAPDRLKRHEIGFAPYRRGSAFLTGNAGDRP